MGVEESPLNEFIEQIVSANSTNNSIILIRISVFINDEGKKAKV